MSGQADIDSNQEKTKHHRIAGLVITPVMERLGYDTTVELDISMQSQLIDIICVRRERVIEPTLPSIYWEVFGELNEHNLISFKSYSESFNGQSLEEFYGHLTNYCKVKKVKREQVNLYVITNHFPKNLLEPLLKTGQVVAQHKGGTSDDVYEMTVSTLQPVRFIICNRTENPILALFSNDPPKVLSAYNTLQNELKLIGDISSYWKQILKHIDQELKKDMYTKEDFLRDYPEDKEEEGILEWLDELAQIKMAQGLQQGIEQGIEQGRMAQQIDTLKQILQMRFGEFANERLDVLGNCTLEQLQTLVNPAMDAPNFETFLGSIPESDADSVDKDDPEAAA